MLLAFHFMLLASLLFLASVLHDTGIVVGVGAVAFVPAIHAVLAVIEKKRKFSSYIRKFRLKQLQSHI